MLKYTLIREDENGIVADVSIFNSTEYKFAEFVQAMQQRIYPAHKVHLEIAFAKTWEPVKSTERYKKYMNS
jgi:hypothetical protein